ncbi:hypothetical protein [Mycolicibacterium tusciae]|uniref:Uncharacterized protein n=1 Tax=Mycolicibacterium tusciae TaxID=75922 RepID=A0A1X0JRA6_9MYCO|nr:hypothetical protein [Mycolicibacterium tusciae]ORB65210.1 hypothetical protein BST47_13995 [Mycolicibacterium tusciae]
MEVNNDRGMPPTATGMRVIVLLLVSICLSIALGLAMLIAALTPASVAAPSPMQSAPCGIAVLWPQNLTSSAVCPVAISSSTCCTRLPIG